jgi:multisubunit Na+/H+ antiporter MnhC subunit
MPHWLHADLILAGLILAALVIGFGIKLVELTVP